MTGHAVDPQGQALAGIEVLLHRVDSSGGAPLGAATTDSAGAFSISAEASADTAAVYFAATRFEEQLYIGPFIREADTGVPYTLVVGGEPMSLGPAIPGGPAMGPASLPPVSPGGGPRRSVLILLPLIALLGVAGWAFGRSTRPPVQRQTLIRLASIDEELELDRENLELGRERARLMERLLAD